MTPEFTMKLGILLGTLDTFLTRVDDETVEVSDIDRMREIAKDVKKKFFEQAAKLEAVS